MFPGDEQQILRAVGTITFKATEMLQWYQTPALPDGTNLFLRKTVSCFPNYRLVALHCTINWTRLDLYPQLESLNCISLESAHLDRHIPAYSNYYHFFRLSLSISTLLACLVITGYCVKVWKVKVDFWLESKSTKVHVNLLSN